MMTSSKYGVPISYENCRVKLYIHPFSISIFIDLMANFLVTNMHCELDHFVYVIES